MISIFEKWVLVVLKHGFGTVNEVAIEFKNMHCMHFPSGLMLAFLISDSCALPQH